MFSLLIFTLQIMRFILKVNVVSKKNKKFSLNLDWNSLWIIKTDIYVYEVIDCGFTKTHLMKGLSILKETKNSEEKQVC